MTVPFKLAIGMASRGYDVVPEVALFITDLTIKYNARLISYSCGFSAAIAQEAIFKEAANSDCDYLLMIDTDVISPLGSFEKLLACNKDIVSAPIWHYNAGNQTIHLNVAKKMNDYIFKEGRGVEEILTTSFGCLLISKYVLNAFKNRKESFTEWSPLLEEKYKPIGAVSSDTIFYFKAKVFGFPIYVNWDVKGCAHYTRVHLSTQVLGRFLDNIGFKAS